MPHDLDARVDELYCLPLDRFVPERDALAKALRGERRREEAAAVAKLAKPSVAAWAVNQVVRSQPKAARELWEAGDAVLGVQQRAVAGAATGAELREAIAAERAALAPLADAARGMLTGRGAFLGEQAVQAVIETLHAAAVDPDARPDVEAGRLARPLRLAGLGAVAGAAVERPAKQGGAADAARPGGDDPPAERADDAAEAARPEAEPDAAADAARREAERARAVEARRRERERERELASARRRLDRARRARDAAAARVERRREELEAAEAELARLEEDVRTAERALEE